MIDLIDEEENKNCDDATSVEENKKSETPITIFNTNARSLCPKIDSFIDCFEGLDAVVGVVTETWLSDGESLSDDIVDLAHGTGIGLICLNRQNNARGYAHGGVAVSFKTSCPTRKLDLPNPDGHEVLCTATKLPGYTRQLVTVACYLPPGLTVPIARQCLSHIEDVVIEVKRRFRDPFLVVAGDFNQWEIQSAMADFPDLREANVGLTRKDKCIDRMFTNFDRAQREAGTVPPWTLNLGSRAHPVTTG